MPEIQLPDGAIRSYEGPVSVMEIAADIHPKLAKRALAGEVDGNLVDMDYRVDSDQSICVITPDDSKGVERKLVTEAQSTPCSKRGEGVESHP